MTLSDSRELRFLSKHVIGQVTNRVKRGVPLRTAFRAAGVTDGVLKRWERIANNEAAEDLVVRSRILQFQERISRAQAEHEAAVVERIQQAIEATNEKTGIPEWRAAAWYLNNAPQTRDTYRQQQHVEVHSVGIVHHEHTLVQQNADNLELLEQWAALPDPEP